MIMTYKVEFLGKEELDFPLGIYIARREGGRQSYESNITRKINQESRTKENINDTGESDFDLALCINCTLRNNLSNPSFYCSENNIIFIRYTEK